MRLIEEYYNKLTQYTTDLESKVESTLTAHERTFLEAYKAYVGQIFLKIKRL
jgi:hypothetical protein